MSSCTICEPLGFNAFGDLVRAARAGRAGPLAVFEREGLGETDLAHERERCREIVVALAGKADDEIGGERDIRPRRAQAIDDAAIIVDRMAAIHRLEHAVRARLHRQMQERHQLFDIAMRLDQLVVHIARMRGRVAQPLEPRQLGERANEPAEAPHCAIDAVAVIGVDVLAQERDLARARGDEPLGFGDHRRGGAREFGAARIGHDAEGAEFIAAFLHREESRDRLRRGALRQVVEFRLGREFGIEDRAAAARELRDHFRQAVIGLRSEHEIDKRRARENLFAFGLRDAARNRR